MSEVIARLERWADGLPAPSEIPISELEVFAVAEYEDARYGSASSSRISNILDKIVNGRYLYRGHRVVVI